MKFKTKLNRKLKNIEKYYNDNRGALWFAFFAGLLVGVIITQSVLKPSKAPLEPQGQTIIQEVRADEPSEEYYKETPIRYLRWKGQQLGINEYEITKIIATMKCESGLRSDAINKNSNGTFDLGVGQINDVHSKRISRADRLDFIKNIDFIYKLYQEQGLGPWVCARKLGFIK